MNAGVRRARWPRAAGLLAVLALHGVVLHGLWSARAVAPPPAAKTLYVSFVDPAPEPPKPLVQPPPKPPRPAREKPSPPKPHTHLAANAPVTSPDEPVEPVPLPAPEPEPEPAPPEPPAPPPAPPLPAGPVTLGTELAVTCPERTPPAYPPLSRRLGETGKVVLRVELDATGRVASARVLTGSGSARLDAAALAAVKAWRCQPAQRDGQAVPAVAMQPFKFTLEGH